MSDRRKYGVFSAALVAAVLAGPGVAHAALVGRWTGDGYSSGSAWADGSGAGNDGAPVGSPVATPGAFNGHVGVTLDGDDYFTVPNTAGALLGAERMTLVAVFRPLAANASSGGQFWQRAGLIGNEQPGGVSDWGLSFGASQAAAGIGGPDTTVLSGALNLNQTYVVAQTWSGSTLTLFVDGVQVAQNTAAPTAPRTANEFASFALGANLSVVNGDLKPFVGQLAELRAYNDVDQNIPALSGSLRATYVPEPSAALGGVAAAAAGLLRRSRRQPAAERR